MILNLACCFRKPRYRVRRIRNSRFTTPKTCSTFERTVDFVLSVLFFLLVRNVFLYIQISRISVKLIFITIYQVINSFRIMHIRSCRLDMVDKPGVFIDADMCLVAEMPLLMPVRNADDLREYLLLKIVIDKQLSETAERPFT